MIWMSCGFKKRALTTPATPRSFRKRKICKKKNHKQPGNEAHYVSHFRIFEVDPVQPISAESSAKLFFAAFNIKLLNFFFQ